MTLYARPDSIYPGQLLWLELEEFPERPKVACRVFCAMRSHRFQVELLASDHSIVGVDRNRLWEEVHAG